MTAGNQLAEASARYLAEGTGQVMPAGYKQTEVGVIPNDWAVDRFVEISNTITCGLAATPVYVSEQIGKPFLSAQNVKQGRVDYSNHKYITKSLFEQITRYNKPAKGDILYTRVGAGIGEAGVIEDDYDFAIYVSLTLIKVNRNMAYSKFICHLLNSDKYRFLAKNGQFAGGGVQNLNVEVVRDFKIPLPRLNEQTAIANALSDVDALINELEKLIAKKQAIKTATMQQLLTGRTRLPQFALHEDGTKKGYKQSELGEIPVDWEVRTVFEIAENQKSLFDDGDWVEAEHITDKGIRLIQTGNIGIGCYVEKESKKYIYPESFEKLKCKELRVGDLLICRLAEPAGRACILSDIGEEKVITSVDVTIFRPKDTITDRRFLVQYFSYSEWFKSVLEQVGGTTHKRISRGALGKVSVPFPYMVEQSAIATILSDMDTDIQTLQQRLSKTRQIKQGMMQELLTGRIRLLRGA